MEEKQLSKSVCCVISQISRKESLSARYSGLMSKCTVFILFKPKQKINEKIRRGKEMFLKDTISLNTQTEVDVEESGRSRI